MSFISFNEQYYRERLAEFERHELSADDLYEARQLLKLLDDLVDEGYTGLSGHLERGFQGVTRLRALIYANGGQPFAMPERTARECEYGEQEYELHSYIGRTLAQAAAFQGTAQNRFLEDIRDYCGWIGYEPEAAYVFLLRDTFLPYLYFHSRGRENIHPWLINRAFLDHMTAMEHSDDGIRLAVYDALEAGITAFDGFSAFCKERMGAFLARQPRLQEALAGLLGTIPQERIIVVESGYCGTIPLLLAAVDARVEIRLFTAAPYLYGVYGARLYCRAYERIRLFETLYSQDRLFRYSGFRNGRFYVRETGDSRIRAEALAEIRAVCGR